MGGVHPRRQGRRVRRHGRGAPAILRDLLLVAAATAAGLLVLWAILIVLLSRARPAGGGTPEAARILPDLLRLIGRLARDRDLPRGVRLRLWALLAYLASPIDLIPDFIPVLGHADDVLLVAVVLRSTIRRAGPEAVGRHWPGTAEGLAAVRRLTRT